MIMSIVLPVTPPPNPNMEIPTADKTRAQTSLHSRSIGIRIGIPIRWLGAVAGEIKLYR